jgi:DNA-binding transcriptional regulator YdaS (Cro superfamily)
MSEENDWLAALREACRQTSQAAIAKRLGLSAATISQVLAGKYPGDLAAIETRVRGELLRETVPCPLLGDITKRKCQDWQKKPFAATNEFRVMMYRKCRGGCPYSKLEEKK